METLLLLLSLLQLLRLQREALAQQLKKRLNCTELKLQYPQKLNNK
jgi:hypothetical protein